MQKLYSVKAYELIRTNDISIESSLYIFPILSNDMNCNLWFMYLYFENLKSHFTSIFCCT